jgi:hypothetical protein
MNTHAYDAKWREEYDAVIAQDDDVFPISEKLCIESIQADVTKFISMSSHPRNIINLAVRYLPQLADPNNAQNKDSTNSVDATEILARIARALNYRIELADHVTTMLDEELNSVADMYKIPTEGHDALAERVKEYNLSMIDSLVEQIADVNNGACSQGRTTRLFQVLKSFY